MPNHEIAATRSEPTIVGGRPTHVSGDFAELVGPLPLIVSSWSPVARYGVSRKRIER